MSLLYFYNQIHYYANNRHYRHLEQTLIAATLAFPDRPEFGEWRDRYRLVGHKSARSIARLVIELSDKQYTNIKTYVSNVERYHATRLDHALRPSIRKLERLQRQWKRIEKQYQLFQMKKINVKLPRKYWEGETIA